MKSAWHDDSRPVRHLEAVPLVKTGGLADVAGALPDALAPHGVEMTTLLPGYPAVLKALGKAKAIHAWDSLLGGRRGCWPASWAIIRCWCWTRRALPARRRPLCRSLRLRLG
jgi:hypothetical protein